MQLISKVLQVPLFMSQKFGFCLSISFQAFNLSIALSKGIQGSRQWLLKVRLTFHSLQLPVTLIGNYLIGLISVDYILAGF